MYIFKYIFIVVAMVSMALDGYSKEGVICGKIQYTNKDLGAFANVKILASDKQTDADMDGNFIFLGLPYGTYQLSISSDIAEAQVFEAVLESDTLFFSVVLQNNQTMQRIEEIQFVHKAVKKEIETKGFAVNVIETKVAAIQNVQTTELLDRSAGVRIRQDGGLGSRIQYNINGLTGNAVKVFIDGIPISNYGRSFSLNSIPPALIERIEVYKGVVPAYLSEDALGGAINVILKNKNRNTLSASYSFGSFNTHQANVAGAYRNSKNGFTFNGAAFYNYSDNNYKVWGKDIFVTDSLGKTTPIVAKRFHDAYSSIGGKLDVGYTNVKWADAFTIGAVVSGADKEVQHGTIMRIAYGNRTTHQQSAVFSASYRKANIIKGLDVNINGSYGLLSRGVVDTIGDMYTWDGSVIKSNGTPLQWSSGAEQGLPTNALDKEHNMVWRASLNYRFNDNNSVFANAFYNSFDRSTTDTKRPAAEQMLDDTRNLSKSVYGITYQNLAFKKRLRTNVFYKYFSQNHELLQPYWEGNVGASALLVRNENANVRASGYGIVMSYQLLPKLYLLASAEKAMRMPNANELFGNAAENITATSSLKPESSTNLNLGFNIGTLSLKQHDLQVNINTFYRETKDMIRLNTIDDLSETNEYTNFESILSYGFDMEMQYNYNKRFFAMFAISRFFSKWNVAYNSRGERYQHYGSQLANEPSFKFNLNLAYHIPHLIQKEALLAIHANVFFVDEFLRNWATYGGNNISVIPMQFTQDIGVNYTFPNRKIIIGLDAKNITNQQVFDNWALQKPGRGFFGKITYNIL